MGGNRCGKVRRYANLLITMALGGLWHGAGWTFLLWGVLHGLYLCINHAWFALRKAMSWPALPKPIAIALTFVAVLVAWVPFRAGNFELGPEGSTTKALEATRSILASMFGLNGFEGWPNRSAMIHQGQATPCEPAPASCSSGCFPTPSNGFAATNRPSAFASLPGGSLGPRRWWQWRPTLGWSLFLILMMFGTIYQFDKLSEFIYFQF